MRVGLGFACALTLAALAPPARAQAPSCLDAETPRVLVGFAGEGWTDAFRRAVLAELSAAFSVQDVAVCSSEALAGADPVARIELRTTELPRVAVVIEVSDRVTDKRLLRDIDLAPFPEDGRALALAVASDELLRASWMELAMSDAREPARPPPPQVERAVERAVARPPRSTIGLRGVALGYGGGEVQLGGELWLAQDLATALSVELSFGLRRGLLRGGQHGEVRSTVVGGGVELRLHLLDGPLRLDAAAGVRLEQAAFDATAHEGALARDEEGLLVTPTVGLVFEWRGPAGLVLSLGGGVGVAAVGVAATDDGERVTAASGLAGWARGGAGWRF